MSLRASLLAGAGPVALLLWTPPAQGQQQIVHFSVDWQGPTISVPDTGFGIPITEADILVPGPGAPGFAPLQAPSILYSGGVAPIPGLGLVLYPPCVGHPPGTPCGIEVDALSFGWDFPLPPSAPPHAIVFSTDEYAFGWPGMFAPPTVWTEAPAMDLAGDLLVSSGIGPIPGPPFSSPFPGSVAFLDADGARSPSSFLYPGSGLIEPRQPWVLPPNSGDNLDALEVDPGVLPVLPSLYFSLDAPWPDPLTGTPHSGSAFAHGFVAGDVLVTPLPGGGPPMLYAPAWMLGLDFQGPETDDLDALILWENGQPGFQPSQSPCDWTSGQTDMLLFSVRRGSLVVGLPDSIFGIPIEPGDILTTPLVGGGSPFPGILIAAEDLGLATARSGSPEPFGDELDAADSVGQPVFDCNGTGVEDALDIAFGTSLDLDMNGIPDECQAHVAYCWCPAPLGPCGNNDPFAGCVNSTGLGGLLVPSGTNSVGLDDLVLTAAQVPPNKLGILLSGNMQVGPMPFGDGLRCAGGLLARWPPQGTGAAGSAVYGPGLAAYSMATWPPAKQLLPGTTWHFQFWFRDPPGPCGFGFNLTNAVQVSFVP